MSDPKALPSDLQDRIEEAARKIMSIDLQLPSKDAVRIATSHVMRETKQEREKNARPGRLAI
ncbi:MAG: hypothetical protein OXI05_11190 [Bacteroidota bacterium]|nr:hypothetical protein [Bacteroidota bacterium]MDE2646383.1 hypothetical protein [Bacteroidota bacterium]